MLMPVRPFGGMIIIVQMNAVHPSATMLIKLLRRPKCQGPRLSTHRDLLLQPK